MFLNVKELKKAKFGCEATPVITCIFRLWRIIINGVDYTYAAKIGRTFQPSAL